MRLLNTSTLRLEQFIGRVIPEYAILSHTWDDDELSFQDVEVAAPKLWRERPAARKVLASTARALRDGHGYIWIDTICIDKTSSAELSEAINSMFRWYMRSNVCYTYLSDLSERKRMKHCRWFQRGWTLQEMIAPKSMLFYDKYWSFLGSRADLAQELASITKIEEPILIQPWSSLLGETWTIQDHLQSYGVASRMNWASSRRTTREEDMAYCLMGIFNVNMPLLYGEGEKAFQRLQEEIIKTSADTSILAFTRPFSARPQLLASHPTNFNVQLPAVWTMTQNYTPIQLSHDRMTLDMNVCCRASDSTEDEYLFAVFDCTFDGDFLSRPAIRLQQVSVSEDTLTFTRSGTWLYKVCYFCKHAHALYEDDAEHVHNRGKSDFSHAKKTTLGRKYLQESLTTEDCHREGIEIDPESLQRKTITIAPDEVEEGQMINFTIPALRVLPIQYSFSEGFAAYTIYKSEPAMSKSLITIPREPVFRRLRSYGMMALRKRDSHVIIAWGQWDYSSPRSIWCTVNLPSRYIGFDPLDLSAVDDSSRVDRIFELFRADDFVRYWSGERRSRDFVVIEADDGTAEVIHAEISSTTFMGRDMFEMSIRVEELATL